ncbi:MAG: FAD-binding protein [Candidatus Latescibacteria bacterium]|nr:FAD-binding protein [bacterium]MBD3425335.1 FAD-binding protein [Candidatus Latescibacterota bacterium]
MNCFDVVIIGAGPAGLRCAYILGDSELRVAVLDKQELPGVKPCAGGITPNTELYHQLPGRYVQFRRHRVVINRREFDVRIREPIRVIDRADLASYQLRRVEGFENITIFKGIRIRSVSRGDGENFVESESGERFYYRYLVGADGSKSVTRSFLGLKTGLRTGLNCRIEASYDRMTWYFNPGLLSDGYCWIFPHRNFLSCGVYYDPGKVLGTDALGALEDFLSNRGIDLPHSRLEGFPVLCGHHGFRFGNIFLCGDAAGSALPATGEGIYPAVLSGESVARYLIGEMEAFSAMNELLRSRKRQLLGIRAFRALRIPLLQSVALEALARFGSRYYMS